MIEIKETNIKDIDNVQRLWADGDVMRFVGFPNGLHQTSEEMKGWFQWIESNRPVLNHYSIFENGNYCGESFYEIDEEHQSAALDIKLLGLRADGELQRQDYLLLSKKHSETVQKLFGSIQIQKTQKRSHCIKDWVFSRKPFQRT